MQHVRRRRQREQRVDGRRRLIGRPRRSRCRRPCPVRGAASRPARAHSTPGTRAAARASARRCATARPSGMPRDARAQRRQRGGDRRFDVRRRCPGIARSLLLAHRGGDVGGRRDAERAMDRRELLDRDGARFEQPAQVGGQIGDRRFDQHPAARLVHLAQPLEDFGVAAGAAGASNSGPASASDSMPCARTSSPARAQQRCLGASPRIVASERELFERLVEGRHRCRCGIARNRLASLSMRPGSGVACFGASFVSVGRFAASQSAMPPLSAAAL